MPKATLEFDLGEPDEQENMWISMEGNKYRGVLWDLDQALRGDLKHNDSLSDETYAKLEEYRKKLHHMIEEAGISTWY